MALNTSFTLGPIELSSQHLQDIIEPILIFPFRILVCVPYPTQGPQLAGVP